MSRRRCKAKTKRGTRCLGHPLKGKDVCLAHADADTRASVGFTPEAGRLGGRPRLPKPHEISQRLMEENVLAVERPYWRTLGFDIEITDEGPVLVELDQGGAKEVAKFQGEVFTSEVEDLGAQTEAAEKLKDRVYGKPRQEITGVDGAPLQLEVTGAAIVSDPNARKHANELRRRLGSARAQQPGRTRASH